MRRLLVIALALAGCNSEEPAQPEPEPTKPVAVLLAMDAESTLGGAMGPLPDELGKAGFDVMSLDLPCHGSDTENIHPLDCWRRRIESGDAEIFNRFCDRLSAAISARRAQRVSIVGQSRGAYVGVICAARDKRIASLALWMPVTDLNRLAEFSGFAVSDVLPDPHVPTYIRIGIADDRVGTDAAIAFGQRIGARIEILNVNGHNAPDDGSTVQFLREMHRL